MVWLTGIGGSLHVSALPLRAWEALALLTIASTLVGYAVFLTPNRRVSPTLVDSFN